MLARSCCVVRHPALLSARPAPAFPSSQSLSLHNARRRGGRAQLTPWPEKAETRDFTKEATLPTAVQPNKRRVEATGCGQLSSLHYRGPSCRPRNGRGESQRCNHLQQQGASQVLLRCPASCVAERSTGPGFSFLPIPEPPQRQATGRKSPTNALAGEG